MTEKYAVMTTENQNKIFVQFTNNAVCSVVGKCYQFHVSTFMKYSYKPLEMIMV